MNAIIARLTRPSFLVIALALAAQACESQGYEHVFDAAEPSSGATPARDAKPAK